ncbi:hypothetical protein [Paracoccus saliphilus]|uniref:Antibiotic ABC transporter n=1 Tax=Paracoccus saliphilus TaxID=405559 RepID=A0AA45W482_9RHOB|nr:hypothetical protein [Paracoccus saliphilus]WCR03980.1 antibiotic ABC transporter [Paracoccus saliphilus]SIS83390.1 hypothetical protein SAMN05421772_10632 [Paracoccus saliphilus]
MFRDKNIYEAVEGPYRLWEQMTRLAMESQVVIGMRVAGMLGMVAQAPGEPFLMVAEKQAAASESLFAMAQAASRGASPDNVMSAALKPYSERAHENSYRLTHGE